MEAHMVNIQGLSSTVGDLSNLHNILKQAHDSLQTQSIRLLPLLDQFDPALHSLGYLYILEACTSSVASREQANMVVLPTGKFINSSDMEQIKLAPEKFISVCKRFKDYVMQLEAPLRGVAPMLTAKRYFSLLLLRVVNGQAPQNLTVSGPKVEITSENNAASNHSNGYAACKIG